MKEFVFLGFVVLYVQYATARDRLRVKRLCFGSILARNIAQGSAGKRREAQGSAAQWSAEQRTAAQRIATQRNATHLTTLSRVASPPQVLKPFLDSGQLDMAIFDAVNDTTIRLSRSGTLLGPGTCVNPICVVANYLFDTLCHDIFQVSAVEVIPRKAKYLDSIFVTFSNTGGGKVTILLLFVSFFSRVV